MTVPLISAGLIAELTVGSDFAVLLSSPNSYSGCVSAVCACAGPRAEVAKISWRGPGDIRRRDRTLQHWLSLPPGRWLPTGRATQTTPRANIVPTLPTLIGENSENGDLEGLKLYQNEIFR